MHPALAIGTIFVSGVFVLLQKVGSLVARATWRVAAGPVDIEEYPYLDE